MNRFACGYCGTEQVVERKGGTVALKPITDAIARVQVGTDKTAAELALNRLPQELNAIISQRREREAYWQKEIASYKETATYNLILVLIAACVCIIPIFTAISVTIFPVGGALVGFVIGLIASVMLFIFVYRRVSVSRDAAIQRATRDQNHDFAGLDLQMSDIKQRIEQNRNIANS
jgi:hypothetical protein